MEVRFVQGRPLEQKWRKLSMIACSTVSRSALYGDPAWDLELFDQSSQGNFVQMLNQSIYLEASRLCTYL